MFENSKNLKNKFIIITFFIYFFLIAGVIGICYTQFYKSVLKTCENIGMEVLEITSTTIENENINFSSNGNISKYTHVIESLKNYTKNVSEIDDIYMYRSKNGNIEKIFDKDSYFLPGLEKQSSYPSFLDNYIDELANGNHIETIKYFKDKNYIMTCSKALFDKEGNYIGQLFVDINLTTTKNKNGGFTGIVFLFSFIYMVVVFTIGMRVVAKRITIPLEKMYEGLKKFEYKNKNDLYKNIENFKSLNIKTNKEIQSLYEMFITTLTKNLEFKNELDEKEIQLEESKIHAETDSLTGVNNKFSLNNKINEYNKKIESNETIEIAVVVADINNLKYVNDNFGHEIGDKYIIGCVKIFEKFFDKKNIYRTGGDEFVILLENVDYFARNINKVNIEEIFEKLNEDKALQPFERYSASIGMSEYKKGESVLDTIKEADKEMYAAKNEFKTKYGSYR